MSKIDQLIELCTKYNECNLCTCNETATQKVFGYGNPDSRILFLGMAPGEEEDKEGIPFIGNAGQLLDEYFLQVGLATLRDGVIERNSDVYLTNLVLCRSASPSGKKRLINRDPTTDEIVQCSTRLFNEIAIVDPLIIVAFGDLVFRAITKKPKIKEFRGSVYIAKIPINGKIVEYPVIPTWHPARLLRQTSLKEGDPRHNVLTDLTKVVKLLDRYSNKIDLLNITERDNGL